MLGFACVIFGSVPAWAQSSLEQTLRGVMVMRVLEWSESHLRDLVAYAKAGVVLDGRIANPPDAASWAELNHDAVRQFVARFWLADDIARYNTRLSRSAPSAPQVDPEAERVLTQSRAVALEILRSYDKDTAQLRLWDADHAAARARERAAFAAWVAQRASLATQVAEDDQWQSEALDNLEARRKTLLVEKLDWESRRAALLADEAHYHDSRRLGIVASTLGSAAGVRILRWLIQNPADRTVKAKPWRWNTPSSLKVLRTSKRTFRS